MTTFLVAKNNVGSTLNGAVDDVVTTWTVVDGTDFPAAFPYHVSADAEIAEVTGKTGNVLTVIRGQEGTTAAAHSNGTDVELLVTAEAITELQDAINALETDHDHTSAASDGGALTNDEHDGYSEYVEIATPGNPANLKLRIFPRPKAGEAGYTEYVVRGPTGDECVLCTLANSVHTNTLILNHIE